MLRVSELQFPFPSAGRGPQFWVVTKVVSEQRMGGSAGERGSRDRSDSRELSLMICDEVRLSALERIVMRALIGTYGCHPMG